MMDQMKTKARSIVRLVGELLNESPLLKKFLDNNLSTSSVVWQRSTNSATQPITLPYTFIEKLQRWMDKIWDMTPKAKERESDEGRDAEDKSQHKGDWGSHSHADKVAEEMEPTLEQLANAQAVINSQWEQEE